MRRAGALLVALAMVGAAFFVRAQFGDDDTGGRGGDGPAPRGLRCPTDLAEICRTVTTDVSTEAAGVTADRLVEADRPDALGAEAWVVPAAWARLVVDERARLDRPPLFEFTDPLASSPVVQVVWRDVADQLRSDCGAAPDASPGWQCVAEHAGDRRVRSGAPPVDTALGLPVAAAQVASLLGTGEYAVNDFGPELRTTARALAAGQVDDPIRYMRLRGPGALGVAGTVVAAATNLSSGFGSLEPLVQAQAVHLVVLHRRDEGTGPTEQISEAFVEAGWDAPTDAPDGLPSDGSVLAAVRTLWKENQR